MNESENESEYEVTSEKFSNALSYMLSLKDYCNELEERVIALERGLEGVLRRLEESGQAEDEAGWFGRPE